MYSFYMEAYVKLYKSIFIEPYLLKIEAIKNENFLIRLTENV